MSVLVGYIETPEGLAALNRAVEEAKLRNTLLLILNTSRGDALVDERYLQPESVRALRQRLDQSGVKYELEQELRGNDAAAEILTAAEDRSVELIVIGMRRRTPVGKLIMGSTAQRILLQAECPVLAVKAGN
ncbi:MULTISPECIES: universal stress protein [unclassified Arthrobacter]|uniref:universal stress protein n=1 Tax=unclassified Arthrobacter TaxID=235627 RepID=UPI000CE406C8|nr:MULTISPECIES: universal stress protein [unclassified Arthrobacter]